MYKYIKRGLDFFISFILLVILFLPMLIIGLFIKLEDKGPVIFKQERTGLNGRNFKLYKFRSMKVKNDVHDFSKQDELTKVGKFIRNLSLDELPQMINVLKGEMSFIGPRPWIPEYFMYMNETQRKRVKVLPGITGLAQVKGRNSLSIDDKIKYDLEYIKKYSFKMDMYVFFKTIYTVFKKESVNIGKQGIKYDLEQLKEENGFN